eukprot:TRINITY_DN3373_c0_g3_i3.p1 TRINITY_DN3373_c0_g3~~TRINITY_DN3373_c0_g3_i3.p1  ORF type:complete len:610 (+),score=193.65 TRINITY_DN3373_c0_g3_i3:77-1906(+)
MSRPGTPKGGAPAAAAELDVERVARSLEEACLTRDLLEQWLARFPREEYKRRVAGAALRFLTADMVYKVGRVVSTVPDQNDGTLIVDAGNGPSEVVLPKNVSNSKLKKTEVDEWMASPSARSPTLLRELEAVKEQLQACRSRAGTAPSTPASGAHRPQPPGQHTARQPAPPAAAAKLSDLTELQPYAADSPASTLSIYPHALIINPDGSPWGHIPISEVVSRVSRDRSGSRTQKSLLSASASISPFGRGAGPAPGSGLFSFNGDASRTADIVMVLEQDKQALIGAEKWVRELMEMCVESWRHCGDAQQLPKDYATRCLQLCTHAQRLLQKDPLLLRLRSPMYIFGDIHGNFGDLYYFMQRLVAFGEISYTGTSFLFLGDYVDRGEHGVECVVYLLCCKLLAPHQVWLLRGNHESPEVNGDMSQYGDLSFRHECLRKFPGRAGEQVWEAINRVFKFLPAAAIVDDKVFCVHGGIPRFSGGEDDRFKIMDDPKFPRFDCVQIDPVLVSKEDPWTQRCRQVLEDLVWSDPVDKSLSDRLDEWGFGDNPRGVGLKTFGSKAVDAFLDANGLTHIFRAHQEKSNGLRICDNACTTPKKKNAPKKKKSTHTRTGS